MSAVRNRFFWGLIAALLVLGFVALFAAGPSKAAYRVSGPTAAPASAARIARTVNSWGLRVSRDESAVRAGISTYPTHWVLLVRALRTEVRDLRQLGGIVRDESGPRAARAKIVTGLSLIADSYSSLARDVLAVAGGPVPARQVQSAIRVDRAGRADLLAGIRQLRTGLARDAAAPGIDRAGSAIGGLT